MERVTADSNVLISALRFGGKSLDLLALAVDGEIELAISDASWILFTASGYWRRQHSGNGNLTFRE